MEQPIESANHDWDILIFTQHWPITVCQQWKEKEAKNTCSFPTLRDIWTVHGIWPTRLGSEGPNFCNNTWHFNPDLISPLEQQLEIYWINIEQNTPLESFWKHEWIKHGTCAASLAALNNEAKYFKMGLDLVGKYDMQTVLSKGNIIPKTQGYAVRDIYSTVKSVLKKNPTVECINDSKTGLSYINEIRICFNKNLELIDCDGIKDPRVHVADTDMITSCSLAKPVMYPNVVPVASKPEILEYDIPWQLNLYRFLQFLIWFTL